MSAPSLHAAPACCAAASPSARRLSSSPGHPPAPLRRCAAPGGDCSKAFKGEKGTYCGSKGSVAYCCPDFLTGAKCWECENAYRCYTGARPSNQICASEGGNAGGGGGGAGMGISKENETILELCMLALLIAVFCAVMACVRARRAGQSLISRTQRSDEHGVAMGSLPVAKPVGAPTHAVEGMPTAQAYPARAVGCPVGAGAYPHPGGCYPHGGGMGAGGNMAMGGAMGFLGGMMVADMMHGPRCGGGDLGGGGGGGFGGGDVGGDFAADI